MGADATKAAVVLQPPDGDKLGNSYPCTRIVLPFHTCKINTDINSKENNWSWKKCYIVSKVPNFKDPNLRLVWLIK